MDYGLNGKIALVSASSRGLGRAIATALAREGARLVMCARDRDQLEETADRICQATGTDVFTVALDLSQPDGPARFVQTAVDQAGGADILVTNIGGPPVGTLQELPEAAWQRAFESLLLSAVRLIREAVPHLERRGGGRIINVASVAARQPLPGLILSNSIRAALLGMAKTLAGELGARGILVNNVCPGRITTDRVMRLDEERAQRTGMPLEQVRLEAERAIPLGRSGQPDELAALVTFLASRQASYITGTTILCDGGFSAGIF